MNRRTLLSAGLGLGAGLILPSMAGASVRTMTNPTGKQKVLWAWAHPDDETIQGGVSLRQHLEAKAADGSPLYDIYLCQVTRGTSSSVLDYLNGQGPAPDKLYDWGMPHDPIAEGYLATDLTDGLLTKESFGVSRMREQTNALAVLQSGTGNTITRFELGLTDGSVTYPDVMAGINAWYAANCAPGEQVWLKGHTWLVDSGSDHKAVGHALYYLAPKIAGGNVRYYVLPANFTSTQAALHPITPAAGTVQGRAVLNAYKAFNSYAPAQGLYCTGHQSVPGDWLAAPKDMYHL